MESSYTTKAQLRSSLQRVADKLESAEDKIDVLSGVANGITARIEGAEGDISSLQTQVDGISVPTKTSDLTNDSGYIKSVNGKSANAAGDVSLVPPDIGAAANENLLINWDFRNPVNKNGLLTYAGNGKYTIDKWYIGNGTASVIVGSKALKIGAQTGLWQVRDKSFRDCLLHQKITCSVMLSSGEFSYGTATVADSLNLNVCSFTNGHLNIAWFNSKNFVFRVLNDSSTDEIEVAAVKLELGEQQTLAHKDASGNWVLNDPPDYDSQYALCVQYSSSTGERIGNQHSNQNLLDNWYFLDPINQKGMTEYEATTASGLYFIDRWGLINYSSAELLGNGVFIQYPGVADAGTYVMTQNIENYKQLRGKTLTVSFLTGEISGNFVIGVQFQSDYAGNVYSDIIPSDGVVSRTFNVPESANMISITITKYGTKTEGSLTLAAAKLELGSQQTLAHENEYGNWVLNDPPPNKALELAKCQRYRLSLSKYARWRAVYIDPNYIDFMIPVPVSLRARPSITNGDFSVGSVISSGVTSGFWLSCTTLSSNGVLIRAAKESHGMTDAYLTVTADQTILDANL